MTEPAPVRVEPATPLERQFWLGEQIAAAGPANWVLARVRVDGPVDPEALDAALTAVARRQEALRTGFVVEDGRVVRRVLPEPVAEPPLRLAPGTGFGRAAAALLGRDTFDIAAGRVHRAAVAPDASGATVYLAVHHIVFDGLSQDVFAAELAAAYVRAVDGDPHEPPARRREPAVELTPERRAELAAHWKALLGGAADLPGEGPSQREIAAAALAEHRTVCSAAAWQAVRAAARQHSCTPYAVLLTAYGRALGELTGASDFCVGAPVVARSASQQDELGCLINTLPVRMPELSGPGALDRVWNAVIESVIGAELPCDEIVAAVRTRASRRMPVYQTLFAFESWQRAEHPAGPVRMRAVPVRPVGGQAELQLQVGELPDGTLECIAQAPVNGPWPERLAELLHAFDRHLDALAPSTAALERRP